MAFAVEIFIIHALGDILSPVLMGKISDSFNSLGLAIIVCMLYLFVGAGISLLGGKVWEKQMKTAGVQS